MLEDGRLTDSQGRVVSFKNTLLICTSNVGSSVISKGGSQLGFALPDADGESAQYSSMRSLVMEELKVCVHVETGRSPHTIKVMVSLLLCEEGMVMRGFSLCVRHTLGLRIFCSWWVVHRSSRHEGVAEVAAAPCCRPTSGQSS